MPRADRPSDRAFDLLVIGEVNPDVVVTDPDPRPAFGQAERIVEGVRLVIGSSSVITACGAARLGLGVAIVGVVGEDALGRYMLDAMAARGLDVTAVRTAPGKPTGASVILSDGRDRAILTARGTIGDVTAADVPERLLAAARHLHIGSWFLQHGLHPGARSLLMRARAAGLSTSVDPNWDPSGRWDGGLGDVLPLLDLLFPNEVEVRSLTGIDDVEAAAIELAARARAGQRSGERGPGEWGSGGSPHVAVKRGSDGALVASADGVSARVPAYPVDAVDTTGAGDTFDAAFISAWLAGEPPGAALRAGAVAGALSTLAVGGVDGQPTRKALHAALVGWAT